MTVGSGLCSQFMAAAETVVGTAVTVTRGYEVDSVKPTHSKIMKTSEGLRACAKGHRERNRRVTGKSATVVAPMTVFSKGSGLWFNQMFGAVTTAAIAASPTYRQIHTPGDLTGKSVTTQGGFPESYSGTVRPYTWRGCKVTDWELSCSMDDLLKLNLTLDAWDWTSSTALVAASYLAGLEEFHWAQMSATIGGTLAIASGRTTITAGAAIKGLRGVTFKGKNPLRTDRRLAGGAGVKSEQVENGFRELTGDLDLEFADRSQFSDVFDTDASVPLQFTWVGTTDDGVGNFPTLRLTYPTVKLDTGTPEVGGPDVVDDKVSFTAFEDNAGAYPMIQLEYESQDTTP